MALAIRSMGATPFLLIHLCQVQLLVTGICHPSLIKPDRQTIDNLLVTWISTLESLEKYQDGRLICHFTLGSSKKLHCNPFHVSRSTSDKLSLHACKKGQLYPHHLIILIIILYHCLVVAHHLVSSHKPWSTSPLVSRAGDDARQRYGPFPAGYPGPSQEGVPFKREVRLTDQTKEAVSMYHAHDLITNYNCGIIPLPLYFMWNYI